MKNKLIYISAFLFGVVLPISTKLGNVALVCFLVSLLFFIVTEKSRINNIKRLFFSTIFLFLLLIMGFFFTRDTPEAINLFGRYIPYLLVPLFLVFLQKETLIKAKSNALNGLAIGVSLAAVFLLTKNFIHYYSI